jgi:uncharacterized RDD family membrane protein YckC
LNSESRVRSGGSIMRLACTLPIALASALAAAAQPTTRPAQQRQWELLSHGSGERFWYAVTTPPNSTASPHTFIREYKLQEEWQKLPDLPGRVVALADLRGQLFASLDDGELMTITVEQPSSRPPLPGRERRPILALAGDEGLLWAISYGEGARPGAAATVPASQPRPTQTLTSAPTTRPEQLQLYKLTGGTWTRVAGLPPDVRTNLGAELSLVVFKGAPTIAYKASPGEAPVLRLAPEQNRWEPLGLIRPRFPIRKVKLMTAKDRLIGWSVGDTGVGSFFFPAAATTAPTDNPWREQALTVPPDARMTDASASAAGSELRLLWIDVDPDAYERFYEQRYDLAGHEMIAVTELPTPHSPDQTTVPSLISWGLLGLLMIVTLATGYRGAPLQVVSVNKVELALAPFPHRLAAGLIDLWPIYVGELLIVHHFNRGVKLSQVYTDRFALWVTIIAAAVYLLHTLVAELIWQRSFGKMFVGLRVVGLDGKRPPAASIVLRNLMRVIEVITGILLLVVFFNPLRQRAGDLTAGTVVVAQRTRIPAKDPEKSD